ncbi:MAG: hypothetical protein ACRCU2_18200, partial [Planktothrix sp.]
MSNSLDLTFIVDQTTKLSIFLNRAPVQIQLGVILISILVSHSLFYLVRKKIKENFPQLGVNLAQETTLAPYWCGLILIPDLLGLGFSLIVLNLFQDLFIYQGWIAGIMAIAINILWVYLFYRIFIVSLCLFIPIHRVKECNFYFFIPIFILYVLREILSLFVDFEKFMQVVVINLFGSAVTIGDILISTVGLYLWVVAISIFEYILWQIINSTKLDSGGAQASLILIRYFLITLGIVIVIGYLGFDSTTFAAITGGLSVGIGFGL